MEEDLTPNFYLNMAINAGITCGKGVCEPRSPLILFFISVVFCYISRRMPFLSPIATVVDFPPRFVFLPSGIQLLSIQVTSILGF